MSHHENHVCDGICAAMDATPANPTARLFKLYDLWKVNKDALTATIPSEEEVVAFFRAQYDRYIRSINIKLIPDVLEKSIHDILWAALEQTIRATDPR